MTGLETVFGGIVVGLIGAAAGKMWGEKGKVSNATCSERQMGCMKVVSSDISYMKETVERIERKVDKMKCNQTTPTS